MPLLPYWAIGDMLPFQVAPYIKRIGISEKELVMLAEKNAKFVSLGKRILRTETAGVVMAGNIIYELEYNS